MCKGRVPGRMCRCVYVVGVVYVSAGEMRGCGECAGVLRVL